MTGRQLSGVDWYRSRLDTSHDEFAMFRGEHLPTLDDEDWLPLPSGLENVADPRVDVVDEVDWRFRVAAIHEALDAMYKREGFVLRSRYGIGCAEQTLEEIAYQLGVTRERVRQIQQAAENRLCEVFGLPPIHVKAETPQHRANRLAYQAAYRAAARARRDA